MRKNWPSQSFAKLTLGLVTQTPGDGEDATEVLRQLQHRLVIAHPFQCTYKILLIDITILLNIFPSPFLIEYPKISPNIHTRTR